MISPEIPEFVVIPATGRFVAQGPFRYIVVDTEYQFTVQLVESEAQGHAWIKEICEE